MNTHTTQWFHEKEINGNKYTVASQKENNTRRGAQRVKSKEKEVAHNKRLKKSLIMGKSCETKEIRNHEKDQF